MKKEKSGRLITRSVAYNLISLVDHCYRKGVEDARRMDDEGRAREFLVDVSATGVYGFLDIERRLMDWKEWSLRVLAGARFTQWNGALMRYFSAVGAKVNQNYLGVIIPVAQAFYARGVKDYTDSPHGCNYSIFAGRTRVFWGRRGIMNGNPRRWVDEIQLCCFDLKRRDEEIWATNSKYDALKRGAMTPKQYDWFVRGIGVATATKDTI